MVEELQEHPDDRPILDPRIACWEPRPMPPGWRPQANDPTVRSYLRERVRVRRP